METPVEILSREEVERLLGYPALDDVTGLRDAAVLATLYYAAATAGEVTSLDVSDLHVERGRLVLRSEGGGRRRVAMQDPLVQLLERYVNESRRLILVHAGVLHPEPKALFLGNRGQRIRVQELRQILGATAKAVGIRHEVNLNILRLSRAWHLREEGTAPEAIQRFLGATSRSGRRVI